MARTKRQSTLIAGVYKIEIAKVQHNQSSSNTFYHK